MEWKNTHNNTPWLMSRVRELGFVGLQEKKVNEGSDTENRETAPPSSFHDDIAKPFLSRFVSHS